MWSSSYPNQDIRVPIYSQYLNLNLVNKLGQNKLGQIKQVTVLTHTCVTGRPGVRHGSLGPVGDTLSKSMSLKSFFSRKKSRPSSAQSTQLSQKLLFPERPQEPESKPEPKPEPGSSIQATSRTNRPPNHPASWSVHRLNLLPPTFLRKNAPTSELSPSPFPRFGHALSATASAAGELFLFGGFAGGSARNDFYAFSWWELSATLSATLLETSGEVPSPRLRHASTRFGTVLLIWGGATNFNDQDQIIGPYDDSLYMLNIGTLDFSKSRPTLAD